MSAINPNSHPSMYDLHVKMFRCSIPHCYAHGLFLSFSPSFPFIPPHPNPSTPALNVVSVCLSARGACQATDDEAGMAHPSARPPGASCCCRKEEGAALPK